MKSVDNLVKLAERFARKISLGQKVFAQPGEIQKALTDAGIWEKSAEVAQLLPKAGVDDGPVAVSIVVDSQLNVNFSVSATPPAAATKLAALLKGKYAAAFKAAIAKAGLSVSTEEPVTVKWLTF